MQNENKARKVADRIAERLQADENFGNYEGGWDDLQSRLNGMYQEIQTGIPAPGSFTPKSRSSPIQIATAAHASQERFNVNEAIVDELVEFFEQEKACSFEPNSKPCDHCAMCSSRGF